MGQIESFFDVKALDLVEDGAMRDVVVAAIDRSGGNDANRGLVRNHRANLNGARMRSQKRSVFEHEGVLHIACGVIGREIERFEVEEIPFRLRPASDFEAHLQKDILHFSLRRL